MTPSISIADSSFHQIREQAVGINAVEVEVQQHADAKFVVMTLEGYRQLRQLVYDDSDWTAEEMLAAASKALIESDEWGGDGMSEYDNLAPAAPNQ